MVSAGGARSCLTCGCEVRANAKCADVRAGEAARETEGYWQAKVASVVREDAVGVKGTIATGRSMSLRL